LEVAGHDGAGGTVEPDAGDLLGRDPAIAHRPGNGVSGRGPPLRGVLLGPGRPWILGVDRRDSVGDRAAPQVDDRAAQTLGADVESEEIGRYGHGRHPSFRIVVVRTPGATSRAGGLAVQGRWPRIVPGPRDRRDERAGPDGPGLDRREPTG